MSPEVAGESGAGAATVLRAVRVDLNTRVEWEIELPDRSEPVLCETLGDAQRVGYLCAAHRSPCELIVCDAFIAFFAAKSSAAAAISHPPTSSPSTRGAPLLISFGAAPEPQSPSCLNAREPACEGRRDQRGIAWRQHEVGSANPAPQQLTTRTTDGCAALRAKSFRTRPCADKHPGIHGPAKPRGGCS
jgi:hypothetical protein